MSISVIKGYRECKESLINPKKQNSVNYQQGVEYKQMSEEAKKLKQPWAFLKFDILSILAFRKFQNEIRQHYSNTKYAKLKMSGSTEG